MDLTWILPLAVGGLISLVSSLITSWVQGRAERKRADRARLEAVADRRSALNREALVRVRDQLVALYVEARTQAGSGERDRIKFDEDAYFETETAAYLIADKGVREAVVAALGAIRGLGPAVAHGRLVGHPVELQVQALYSAVQLVSAELRGDPLPEKHLAKVTELGEATDETWKAIIANGQAARETDL